MLASPATASPASMEIARGRKIPISTPSAASGTNSPFDVTESRKSGPPPPPPMSRISDRRKRVDTRRLRGSDGAASWTLVSAADIEALPREADKEVLETRRRHGEPAHRHPGADERRKQVLGSLVARTTPNLAVDRHQIGDPQPAEL